MGRKLVSSLTGAGSVAGVGQIRGMYNSGDQTQAAVDDLLGAPQDAQHVNLSVHKLRGIRDLYHMLTGDCDYHGGYHGDRVQLATTAILPVWSRTLLTRWSSPIGAIWGGPATTGGKRLLWLNILTVSTVSQAR